MTRDSNLVEGGVRCHQTTPLCRNPAIGCSHLAGYANINNTMHSIGIFQSNECIGYQEYVGHMWSCYGMKSFTPHSGALSTLTNAWRQRLSDVAMVALYREYSIT